MSQVRGYYFDGRSSVRRTVSLVREGDELHLQGDGVDRRYPLAGICVAPPVGTVRRSLRFPDGSLCEVINDTPFDELLEREGTGLFQRLLHRWERNLFLVVLSLLVTVAVLAGFIKYGIPSLAKHVALAVPPATERTLGNETLAMLDKLVMKPSALPADRRQAVGALFRRMQPDLPGGREYRLEFRASDRLGANAFALPSGIIVVTDGMVRLARSDDEIAAVLAHEAGHVRYRHALRHVLQNSGTGLLIAAITGDILSITSLSATLPTALIDAKYSRDFEREADDAAVAFMKLRNIRPKVYADMLARLQAEHDRRNGGKEKGGGVSDYFSSHPVTAERIRRVMGE
ncbi:M48 family metallopeptidase [Geobacter argillaceus]|uniref:Peptidase M48-like protein n=1 Tax=Geobacter argillaceus TaxID=345631 RepID=A0A562V6Z4_9BACT|nr:M48 family metallopeptidase [Geobacter argillaceus]TWJ13653.1 peptidase M48-like protein [Geobacter argillaceus]